MSTAASWPALPLDSWEDTRDTLHMWTQMAGKIRLALTPRLNHWWNVTLYVTPRGLATSAIPWQSGSFDLTFDFIDHRLAVTTSAGEVRSMALAPRTVADFYRELMTMLASLDIHPHIWSLPAELDAPIRFDEDLTHKSYDADAAQRFWRALVQVARVMEVFRARFLGKCSPVHFFWGSFDLAVTRFSGRRAPEHPEWGVIEREAYSHECSSVGFWPGGGQAREARFFAYAAPEPPGYAGAAPMYDKSASMSLLSYDAVRNAADPDAVLLDFFQGTYDAAATLGGWDRAALERSGTK